MLHLPERGSKELRPSLTRWAFFRLNEEHRATFTVWQTLLEMASRRETQYRSLSLQECKIKNPATD